MIFFAVVAAERLQDASLGADISLVKSNVTFRRQSRHPSLSRGGCCPSCGISSLEKM